MAQTQLYAKRSQLHIAVESTTDVHQAPGGSGTGMVLVENIGFSIQSEQLATNFHRPDYLQGDEIPGSTRATLTFEWPLRGSGTAGTAPQIATALKACGMKETTVPATSVTYVPISTFDGSGGNPGASYSFNWLLDGTRWAIKGGFGSFVLVGEANGFARLRFTMQGAFVDFADDGLESPTYQTAIAARFSATSFSTNFGGSHKPKGLRSFELDLGNVVTVGEDFGESSGIYGARITSRRSFGHWDGETTLAATKNWPSIRAAGTSGTITTGDVGPAAGNIWRCNVNRATLRPYELQAANGEIARYRQPFAVSSAGTDVEGTNADVELIFK